MGSSAKAATVTMLFLALAVVVAVEVTSLSGGIAREGTAAHLPEAGCICHGGEAGPTAPEAGAPSDAVTPFLEFEPNPWVYEPNAVYNVTLGVRATDVTASADPAVNKMGFNLHVSAGKLLVSGPEATFATTFGEREATHTAAGDKRGEPFRLQWQAPASADEVVVFQLFVNTVNGDFTANAADHWNGLTVVVRGSPDLAVGEGAHEASVKHLGVDWFAFYVGGVAFLFMFAVLFVTYFVFKYGETVHTTDERDRPEKE